MCFHLKHIKMYMSAFTVLCIAACGGGSGNDANTFGNGDGSSNPALGAASPAVPNTDSDNFAPQIYSVSLGCDLATEAIAVQVGETTVFSLLATDESPDTLQFQILDTDAEKLSAFIDDSGSVTITGISTGELFLPIRVIDEDGLNSEIILSIVVEV